ncbi:MAG: caspase family protein [Bacillota bacterium]
MVSQNRQRVVRSSGFSKQGNKIVDFKYDPDGKISKKYEYKYDTIGRRIEQNQYTINGSQGEAGFIVQFTEQNGFDSDPVRISVKTTKYDFPNLSIVDYKFYSENGTEIRLGGRSKLELLIQNTGQGKATDVRVSFCNPGNVFPANDTVFGFPEIKPNGTQKVTYEFFTNKRYSLPTIPISVILANELNTIGETKTFTAYLNRSVSDPQMVSLNPIEQAKKITITEVSLTPSVDRNIPRVVVKYPKRFALIIGNEDYATYQRSISSEINVLYAVNDATVFREYAITVLGIEEKNVFFETNATAGIMYQKIDQVCKILERVGPEGELIFFYAGHGQPDEITRIPYLMPVDVSASNLPSAIKLSDLYARLGSTGAKRITIFLDACFSGGGRQSGLLAARSVKVKPVENEVSGNVVVFSASSGEQSALPFNENSHGMFTYFLLKKLQETQGKITYKDLSDYLKEQVSVESIRSNGKVQDPQVNTSAEVANNWGVWMFQ